MKLLINMAAAISLCVPPLSVVNAKLSAPVMVLAKQCAPEVHPLTMGYLVGHESRNSRFAINVNVPKGQTRPAYKTPATLDEATALVTWLETHGYNFDVGLGQINSANFRMLNVTASQLFDSCTNLRAAQTVLKTCYASAVKIYPAGQVALRHALSCYNTGSLTAGITNGYVAKVTAQLAQSTPIVPALKPDGAADTDLDGINLPANVDTESQTAQGEEAPNEGDSDAFSSAGADAFGSPDAGAFNTKRASPGA
ncbi:lytic transglycosylase domain-containing protein [Enterobacter sp.]|jgi:type IV secretion system protein VirB1|uniref:lytic transglycosylase domain-containing protein n=1 Tax=Enterobacter sp. TaxID=42895 RepID=UPI00296E5857|nr:lytic transglycosylase domain-containing protein [Enterobacter sp.]